MNYDSKDKDSIYNYATHLKGRSFKNIIEESPNSNYDTGYDANHKHKGNLGEIVEEYYFDYKPDSLAQADFPEAKVELKVTPYKVNKNQTLAAKERLVISMINYHNIVEMDFYNSNVWKKIENILIIYYKWEKELQDNLDYLIDYVYMYNPSEQDLKIIQKDFYDIKKMVMIGEAHNLSEAQTLYLGAVTKSSNSQKRTTQPNSEIQAKPRAFSLKSSFMTNLLRTKIIPAQEKLDSIIKNDTVQDFEQFVLNSLKLYKGISVEKLFNKYFGSSNLAAKNQYSLLILRILGVKTNNAEEFEKAGIKIKTIRVQENNTIKEHMSFPHFKVLDLIEEEWYTSGVKEQFEETKFLFIIFKELKGVFYFHDAKFWNMDQEDIDTVLKKEWSIVHSTFVNGIELTPTAQKNGIIINNNLPKASKTKILHVRPHTSKSFYLIDDKQYGSGTLSGNSDLLPNGNRMTKQCFWLNKSYILEQIIELI